MEKLSIDRVREFVHRFDRFPKDQQPPPLMVNRAFDLAIHILLHFLGQEWVRKERESKEGLLSDSKLGSPSKKESWESTGKPIRLAELLLNLQDVVGFEEVVNNLRKGDLESYFAELESAGMLLAAGFRFGFVKPVGQRGKDYDIVVTLEDGSTVPLEVESKAIATTLSEKTISNTIEHARQQLPSDKPGFILIRIPDGWSDQAEFNQIMKSGVFQGIKQSGRIVGVLVWWKEYVSFDGGLVRTISRHLNFLNPGSRNKPEYIRNIADLTWNKAGKWDYLVEIVMSVLRIPPDESFRKIDIMSSNMANSTKI